MLHQIGQGPREGGASGVVPRLMDCHDRIRRHVAIAIRLGTSAAAPTDQISAAATQCISYFHRALPQHSADEDESVAPHLPETLAAQVATIAEQHMAIHALLDRLLPLWRELTLSPEKLVESSEQLATLAAELKNMFDEHLALEESIIFPAIAALEPELQESIVKEMVARRTPF